jgi:hypothetical protein
MDTFYPLGYDGEYKVSGFSAENGEMGFELNDFSQMRLV